MASLSISQFLALYGWFPLTALLFVMLLIARFYQKFSGKRMYFPLYAVAIIAFGVAVVRYASLEQIVGDAWGDFALAVAGCSLLFCTVVLWWHMVIKQKPQDE